MKHTITVKIFPDGKITSKEEGVSGPKCKELSAFLDDLGVVVEDTNTPDFYKPDQQAITIKGGGNG